MSQLSPQVPAEGHWPAPPSGAEGRKTIGADPTGPQVTGSKATAVESGADSGAEWSENWALWLRRGDRLFVGTLTGLALLFLGLHWGRMSTWGTQPIEIEHLPTANYRYEIDINTATWVEWSQFDGVGETLARRIVAEREQHGPYETIDDLRRVKGLGQRVLEEIRPHLTIRYAARPVREEPGLRSTRPSQPRQSEPGEGDSPSDDGQP